jgi:hypothetical protein
MSAFAAKIARLASAEGEEDVDILRQLRTQLVMAEAAAILRAGSSASLRAQAAEKIITACSGYLVVEFNDIHDVFIRAYFSTSSAADAADVGAVAATCALYLEAIVLMRLYPCGDARGQISGQIVALLEEIRAGPEAVDESLRHLGTTLTASRLELFSLECLVSKALTSDPFFSQRPAFARRQAFPLCHLPPRHRRLRCSALVLPPVERCLTRSPCTCLALQDGGAGAI